MQNRQGNGGSKDTLSKTQHENEKRVRVGGRNYGESVRVDASNAIEQETKRC